jgi:hypothetical protein
MRSSLTVVCSVVTARNIPKCPLATVRRHAAERVPGGGDGAACRDFFLYAGR